VMYDPPVDYVKSSIGQGSCFGYILN
jgi:hypothetical protein